MPKKQLIQKANDGTLIDLGYTLKENELNNYATKVDLNSKVNVSTYESDITDLETSIDKKADKSSLNNYLPLSGGTLSGNLTGQYITGTWLQATASNHLSSTPSSYAVWKDGRLYNRTADELLQDIKGMKVYPQSKYDCNTCYDVGVYLVYQGSNCPSGSPYGSLLVMPYRNAYSNTTPDYGTQIFIPNGDDSTSPNSMFYRTSQSGSWNSWQKVISNNDIRNGSIQLGTWSSWASFGSGKLPSAGLYLVRSSYGGYYQYFIEYWDGSSQAQGTATLGTSESITISIIVSADGTLTRYKGSGTAGGGFYYVKLMSV